MKEQDFIAYLDGHDGEFDYARGDFEGNLGVYIKNKRFDTEIHITYATIEAQELNALITATHCGMNVDQITRVTGFLSLTSGWNRGKQAELKDRYRSEI